MKRLAGFLIITFAMFFLSVGSVSAAVCANPNQKLFGISDPTNAHGEIWSQLNYAFEVCYNDYFTQAYSGGTPHTCTGTNVVLRLSGATDAHAEVPGGMSVDYQDTCFGDLECFNTTGACNTDPRGGVNYCTIVSIDALTNTHLSFTSTYSDKICCKATTPGVNCKCNYDTICQVGNGETVQNCPDCVSVCGDSIRSGVEECDTNDLGGQTCASLPGEQYASGPLGCYPAGHPLECQYNIGACVPYACNDGIDNEGDGGCDYNGCSGLPADFACSSPTDNDETDATADCQDGADNDGDGFCDTVGSGCSDGTSGDAQCTSSQDPSEYECGDGIKDPDEACDTDDFGSATCESGGFGPGDLTCTSACEIDYDQCGPTPSFCELHQPFLIPGSEPGLLFSPSSCDDYNDVYPGAANASLRQQLCLNDCVPGASDPVNNGYGGLPLTDWGCGWDASGAEGGRCFFYFNRTSGNSAEQCRVDYDILRQCGPNDPFRLVNITSTPFPPGGAYLCDACGTGASSCQTQIICPRVIQLPFIGIFGIVLSIILIACVYLYLKRRT